MDFKKIFDKAPHLLLHQKLKKNKLLTIIRTFSTDCTEKKMQNYKAIFEKSIGSDKKPTDLSKKLQRMANKNSLTTNFTLGINPIYKPLNLRCYTPLYTLQKSTPKQPHHPKNSLLGQKIEKIMKHYSQPEKSDASTCT